MRFLSIDIESFASIGKASFDLASQGLVVVTGQNKDAESSSSNGSGKSTLVVDSICWALFGKTTKGGSADSVTPGGNGKGTRVVLKFESGGKTYEVARNRKHKVHASKTQIIESGVDITKATVADSDKLLAQILGITLETFLYTTILGQGMMFRFSQLTDQARKEILEGIAASAIYENARVLARTTAQTHERDLMLARSAYSGAEVQLNSARTQLATFHDLQKQSNLKCEQTIASLQQQKQSIEAEQARLRSLLASSVAPVVTANEALYEAMRSAQGKSLTGLMTVGNKVTEIQTRIRMINKSVADLKSVGPTCSACGSAMTPEHMAQEYVKRTADLFGLESELQSALAEQTRIHAASKNLDAEIANMQATERKERETLQRYEEWSASMFNSCSAYDFQINSLAKQITATKPEDYSRNIESSQASIDALTAKLKSCADTIAYQDECKAAAEFWTTGFQEIRVQALDTLLVFLNSRLAHYSAVIMGKDISVSLAHNDKGKIDLNVTSAGSSYQSASGGEKDRIDVCIAFALLDLARQCTDWSSNILVLDEIATFVDAAGVDRIMRAVTELMDQVESAFVISHSPVFEGYGDKVWTVVKEGGVSKLEK